jgi:integrase
VPYGPLVRLLLLTGQRRAEVAEMRWSEIDFKTRAWTLPKERAKNGVAHTVPLLPQAVEILETLPRIAGEDDLVFTSNGKTPVSGFSKAKARIDAVLPDLPHWTFHDLRRTFASGCAKLGVNLPVIEKLLIRARTGEGERRPHGATVEAHRAPEASAFRSAMRASLLSIRSRALMPLNSIGTSTSNR